MDYTHTKKAFRQIENWRKEIAQKEQKHINNITDKNILLYLAKEQVKNLSLCGVSVPKGTLLFHLKALTKQIEDSHCYGFDDVLEDYIKSNAL